MIIAEKFGAGIGSLSDYESHYKEGDTGELIVYLQTALDHEEIEQLKTEICEQGVVLTAPIQQDARMLIIKFKRAVEPLHIIAAALIAAGLMISGWQLLKETTIPTWVWILGGVAGAYCIFRLFRRKK